MNFIASNPINLGREEQSLIPCGFPEGGLLISCKSSELSKLGAKEEMQLPNTRPKTADLQAVYLHQSDPQMIARYRTWAEWLSESRTRKLECELIALDGNCLNQALAHVMAKAWDVLIVEPSSLDSQMASDMEVRS